MDFEDFDTVDCGKKAAPYWSSTPQRAVPLSSSLARTRRASKLVGNGNRWTWEVSGAKSDCGKTPAGRRQGMSPHELPSTLAIALELRGDTYPFMEPGIQRLADLPEPSSRSARRQAACDSATASV